MKYKSPRQNVMPGKNYIRKRSGWAVWTVCLAILFVGISAAWKPIINLIQQAEGVRGLLQAGMSLSETDLANPFICLRPAGNTALAKEAAEQVSDAYLRGVGLCMAGERAAGLEELERSGKTGQVQYAVGISAVNTQEGIDALKGAGLGDKEMGNILLMMSNLDEIDPYPVTMELARVAGDQNSTWARWLQLYYELAQAERWQEGLAWLEEGLKTAPANVRASLLVPVGFIYSSYSTPSDPETALGYFNMALEQGGWLYPGEEASAYMGRGQVYRMLKDQYSPEQALTEYKTALEIQPGSYWALVSIGDIYRSELGDFEQAEAYYRQAVANDNKNPFAYYNLGELYRATGESQAAAEWYRQALERQPDFQPAIEGLEELGRR